MWITCELPYEIDIHIIRHNPVGDFVFLLSG